MNFDMRAQTYRHRATTAKTVGTCAYTANSKRAVGVITTVRAPACVLENIDIDFKSTSTAEVALGGKLLAG